MNQLPDTPYWWLGLGAILFAIAVMAIASHYWPADGSDYPPAHQDDEDSFEGWQ